MPKTLLIADDSVTIRKVIGMIFSTEDFSIAAVDNGLDAIAKTRELKPDLVLADVTMPGKSGYEVCEALKADPQTQSIPVVLLAGSFEPFDEGRAKAARADDHIKKPFESQALLDKVRNLVGGVKAGPAPVMTFQTQTQAQAAQASQPPRPQIPQAQPAGGPLPRPPQPAGMPVARPPAPVPTAAMPLAPRPGAPGGIPSGVAPAGMRPGTPMPGQAMPGQPVARPGVPQGAMPPGARPGMPPGGMPPGARPGMPGVMPPGAVPAGGRPAGMVPGQPMARPAVPPGAAVPGSPRPGVPGAPGGSVLPPGMTPEVLLREVLSRASKELIERIVWEVVPQLAEVIIREHVERLAQARGTGGGGQH